MELSPQETPAKPDQLRMVSDDLVEISFHAPLAVKTQLEQLKGLLAHKNPNISLAEIFGLLLELGIQKWSPAAPVSATSRVDAPGKLSAQKVRRVWQKAQSCCQNCGSVYALEVEHRVAQAMGGDSSENNLRLFCRNCNQRAAIETFGVDKMEMYLNPFN